MEGMPSATRLSGTWAKAAKGAKAAAPANIANRRVIYHLRRYTSAKCDNDQGWFCFHVPGTNRCGHGVKLFFSAAWQPTATQCNPAQRWGVLHWVAASTAMLDEFSLLRR